MNVAATTTLGALERQLGATQQLLAHSEADRARIARQAIAARALERIEVRRGCLRAGTRAAGAIH